MSEQISSLDKPFTLADWHEAYQKLLPYLGGNKAVDSSPIGHFAFFLLPSAPAGYLACEGQRLSATAFPLLFNELKKFPAATRATWGAGDADWETEFDLPDMRGEFPRVSGTNAHSGQGSGAAVGVHQDGTSHINIGSDGNYKYLQMKGLSTGYVNSGYFDSFVKSDNGMYINTAGNQASGSDTNSAITFTSRPTNTSFLGCVKYTYVTQEVDYSTTEHVVGTWIDGKPLYQKTINCGTLPNAGELLVDINVNNIEKIVCFNAIGIDGIGQSIPIPNVICDSSAEKMIYQINIFFNSSNKIRIMTGSNRTGYTGYVTIRYTKTTD